MILFPRPRELSLAEGLGPALDRVPEPRRTPGMAPESFAVDGLVLRHGDDAGLRYGLALLEQIRAQCTGRWPRLRVRDSPDFPVRGYLLDVSRGRVPTRTTLGRLVELLALARYNHLQLYTEHTFAYRDHERVWRAASPITPADLRWLDERCADAGVTLVANQNCFGHMERWLSHEPYRGMAESPEGTEFGGLRLPPSTLRPGPESAGFVLGLLAELLPNFSARTVNINCDEPVDLGLGASAGDAAARGRSALYLEQLHRIAGPLVEQGREVLFWGDMLRSDPAAVEALPAGTIALPWTYTAPRTEAPPPLPERYRPVLEALTGGDPLAVHGAGFEPAVAPFAAAGHPFWVTPGTSTWNSLVGRVDNAYGNMADASVAGLARGASGYLVADWGDNGHLQPPSVSYPPLVYGGATAWCGAANRDLDVPAVLDRHVFEDSSGTLGTLLDSVGRLWTGTGRWGFTSSPLQASLLPSQPHIVAGETDQDLVRQTIATLDGAAGTLRRATPLCSDAIAVLHELEAAIRLARHGALRLRGTVHDPAELRADLAEAIDLHTTAWHGRSRPGGLDLGTRALHHTLREYRVRRL
ncbi:hypothetical protein [Actinocorallia longicatena]|uniref:Beta-N-acetylhexosaminidase n=1 Tax=Actinocorallia longicatena TaxID=111803 RepID=A0ABP6PW10_9ACTN